MFKILIFKQKVDWLEILDFILKKLTFSSELLSNLMASPLIKQLKQSLSPRSPLMGVIKSPFKGNLLKKCHYALTPKRPVLSTRTRRKLLPESDVLPTLSICVPTERPKQTPILALEPNVSYFLENGVEEKNVIILGKGSFGTVILSELKGERVAVKIVKNNVGHCTIKREMNALILSHQNVVDVIQVIHNAQKPYGIVVMKAWSPLTLQVVVERTLDVDFQDSLRLFVGISKGLDYCHEVGIAHLDVKPKNILIDLNGMQSKLCDFGNSYNFKCFPKPTIFQGTVAYIAPELFRGEQVSDKCDVYSFGITMWQILHRDNPYPDKENHALIYQVVASHLRPQSSIDTFESKGYVRLYEKCWQSDPKDRPSMSTVSSALQGML